MQKLNEIILITKCLEKDRKAQKELFERYKNMMYTLAYRITNDHENANDALQDSFIEAFKWLSKLKRKESFRFWLKKIVVRNAIRMTTSSKQYINYEESIINKSYKWDFDFDAEVIDIAIRSLPSKNRTIFILIEIEGYKHKEVAEILNISVGTSKSQLNYAKKLLQIKLWNHYKS